MPPKRAKGAVGAKRTVKTSGAPAKTSATRKQPTRTARSTRATATVDDDDQIELTRPVRPRRKPAKKVGAASEDGGEPAGPAAKGGARRVKRAAADDDSLKPPAAKRPRRGKVASPPPVDPADGDDVERAGGLPADDAENSPDMVLVDNTHLAEAELADIPFRLRDETDLNSRIFYRLRLYLRRSADGEDAAVEEAGYIHAHRIAKSTRSHPDANSRAWIEELLRPQLRSIDDEVRETAVCLRALFTQTGAVAGTKVRSLEHRQSLEQSALVFIQMIHIRHAFQRQGLLTPLLQNWQALLQRLPEWFAFAGNVLLVPGKPDNAMAARAWAGRSDEEVEEVLKGVYEREGFVVWAENSKVAGEVVTVMGRSVPFDGAEEEDAGEGGDGPDTDGAEDGE